MISRNWLSSLCRIILFSSLLASTASAQRQPKIDVFYDFDFFLQPLAVKWSCGGQRNQDLSQIEDLMTAFPKDAERVELRDIVDALVGLPGGTVGLSQLLGVDLSSQQMRQLCTAALPLKIDWVTPEQIVSGYADGIASGKLTALLDFYQVIKLLTSKSSSESQHVNEYVYPVFRKLVLTRCLREKLRSKSMPFQKIGGGRDLQAYFQNNLRISVSEVSYRVFLEGRNLKSEVHSQTGEFAPPLRSRHYRIIKVENASLRSNVEERVRVDVFVDDIKIGNQLTNAIAEATNLDGIESEAEARFQHLYSALCFRS